MANHATPLPSPAISQVPAQPLLTESTAQPLQSTAPRHTQAHSTVSQIMAPPIMEPAVQPVADWTPQAPVQLQLPNTVAQPQENHATLPQ